MSGNLQSKLIQLSFLQKCCRNVESGVGEDDHGALGLPALTVGGGGDLEAELILWSPDWYGRHQIIC